MESNLKKQSYVVELKQRCNFEKNFSFTLKEERLLEGKRRYRTSEKTVEVGVGLEK